MFPKIKRCTPKSSILIGFSIINHPFWGTPILGNTHLTSLKVTTNCQDYMHEPLHEAVEEVKCTYIDIHILEAMFTNIGDIHKHIINSIYIL